MVCSTEGSTTSTFWKRRDKAASFSKMPRYSVKVVAPMHFIAPLLSAGLSRLEAVSYTHLDVYKRQVFGKVVAGMDVVDKIKSQPTHTVSGHQNVPVTPVFIRKASVEK